MRISRLTRNGCIEADTVVALLALTAFAGIAAAGTMAATQAARRIAGVAAAIMAERNGIADAFMAAAE